MIIQGIEDTLDQHDDFERNLDERRRMGADLENTTIKFPIRTQRLLVDVLTF
jgi:hypothetical protein